MLYFLTAFIYTQTGRTPLSWACKNGLSNVAQLLINKGAHMDITDEVSYHNENKVNIACHLFASGCAITTHVKVIFSPSNCLYIHTDWTHSFILGLLSWS